MDLEELLGAIVWLLAIDTRQQLAEMELRIMATLEDILAEETAEGGQITTLIAAYQASTQAIAALQSELDALAPGTLTAAQQAAIDGVFTAQHANEAAVAGALPAVTTPVTDPIVTPVAADGS